MSTYTYVYVYIYIYICMSNIKHELMLMRKRDLFVCEKDVFIYTRVLCLWKRHEKENYFCVKRTCLYVKKPYVYGNNLLSGITVMHTRLSYRVAKTHMMPYLYRSFSAKEPYN